MLCEIACVSARSCCASDSRRTSPRPVAAMGVDSFVMATIIADADLRTELGLELYVAPLVLSTTNRGFGGVLYSFPNAMVLANMVCAEHNSSPSICSALEAWAASDPVGTIEHNGSVLLAEIAQRGGSARLLDDSSFAECRRDAIVKKTSLQSEVFSRYGEAGELWMLSSLGVSDDRTAVAVAATVMRRTGGSVAFIAIGVFAEDGSIKLHVRVVGVS